MKTCRAQKLGLSPITLYQWLLCSTQLYTMSLDLSLGVCLLLFPLRLAETGGLSRQRHPPHTLRIEKACLGKNWLWQQDSEGILTGHTVS
jgi:hypothetical protein